MKILASRCFGVLFAVLLAAFASGCGGDGGKEKINVQSQIQNLTSQDNDARVNALVELAKAGPDATAAVKPLIPLLKDPDGLVRRLAAYALGQIGPTAKEAVATLQTLLTDPDRNVVTAALNAIRAIDPKAAGVQSPPNVTN